MMSQDSGWKAFLPKTLETPTHMHLPNFIYVRLHPKMNLTNALQIGTNNRSLYLQLFCWYMLSPMTGFRKISGATLQVGYMTKMPL